MKGPFTSFVKEEEFCGGLALEATCRIPLPQRCHEEGGGVPLNMSPRGPHSAWLPGHPLLGGDLRPVLTHPSPRGCRGGSPAPLVTSLRCAPHTPTTYDYGARGCWGGGFEVLDHGGFQMMASAGMRKHGVTQRISTNGSRDAPTSRLELMKSSLSLLFTLTHKRSHLPSSPSPSSRYIWS